MLDKARARVITVDHVHTPLHNRFYEYYNDMPKNQGTLITALVFE
jgi:hypothetical protein